MRKRVVWDETNLADNEEYRRLHPVTMRIDEPKTPFVHEDGSATLKQSDDDAADGEDQTTLRSSSSTFEEALVEAEEGDGALAAGGPASTWDPTINDLAHKVRVSDPGLLDDGAVASATTPSTATGAAGELSNSSASCSSSSVGVKRARPVAIRTEAVDEATVARREQQQAEATFKRMRKAVYADEGAKFRSLLGQKIDDDDDDDADGN